jgi:hypothetical protein
MFRFSLQVGTPPQPFQVLPSISGQAIYVPVDQDCAPERMKITDRGFKRGVEVFESQRSLRFQRNKSSTWAAEHKQAGHFTGLVEADSVAPIHELPTTVHELSAFNDYRRKPV